MNKAARQSGITLIETLVALAIMGLTTAATLILIGQNTRFASQALARTYASIAVDNLMVEALAQSGPIERGVEEGSITLADREYNFSKVTADTSVANVVRIEIEISSQSGQALSRAQTLRWLP